MCVRASEESLTCAAHTTFWPQKTADILSYPQKTKDQTKKEAMHTFISFKKKSIRDPPLVISRSPLVAPVIGC